MKVTTFKRLLLLFVTLIVLVTAAIVGSVIDRTKGISLLDRFLPRQGSPQSINERIVNGESVVTDIAEKVSPSVVTISVETPQRRVLEYSPFGGGFNQRIQGGTPQDIGSGFVVSEDGLIATNKHVVSSETATYNVITKDGKEYKVESINRDPANDLAILKITASGLTPLELGSSGNLKVGQFVVAIGTALGQFRHTVTTGVISGLGRGITAGDPYEGFAEKLDDVIQTDAAINPGNSGGPLLNSAGQVIGVNVAVAEDAQNIGFALPVDLLKKGLEQFRSNGSFASKPFLGVQYQMLEQQAAVLNNLPQGAYVVEVIDGSPAARAGIQVDDILLEIDGERLSSNEEGLAGVVSKKSAGSTISIKLWRKGAEQTVSANLSNSSE